MKTGSLLAVLILAVGCVDGGPVTTTTTEPGTTSSLASIATTTSAGSTTVEAVTTTTTDPIDVAIAGGVASGSSVFSYDLGDTVGIIVVSDVDDELHVHGYDLIFDLTADVPITLGFVADVPGVFEVEIHSGHAHVFDIEVSG